MNFKHGFLMLLFCTAPFIVLGVLKYFGYDSTATWLLLLLCPLSHLLMGRFMHKEHERQEKNVP